MNAVEYALAKQRLQLTGDAQRVELATHIQGLAPLFDTADRIHAGAEWVRRHPEIIAGTATVLLAARPGARRFAWRWGRRAYLAWRFWRDSRRWLDETPAPSRAP